jgi:hypothetical protein
VLDEDLLRTMMLFALVKMPLARTASTSKMFPGRHQTTFKVNHDPPKCSHTAWQVSPTFHLLHIYQLTPHRPEGARRPNPSIPPANPHNRNPNRRSRSNRALNRQPLERDTLNRGEYEPTIHHKFITTRARSLRIDQKSTTRLHPPTAHQETHLPPRLQHHASLRTPPTPHKPSAT